MWGRVAPRLGWALIALSPLPWLGILALPFFGLSLGEASLWGIGLLLTAEGLFLVGAALVGPSLVRNRKAILKRLFGGGDDDAPPRS